MDDSTDASFACPVCGEDNSTDLEILQEEGRVVQDCWVCCRPLVLSWEYDHIAVEPE